MLMAVRRMAALAVALIAVSIGGTALMATRTISDCPPPGLLRACVLVDVHFWDARWWTDLASTLLLVMVISLVIGFGLSLVVGRGLRSPRGALLLGTVGILLAVGIVFLSAAAPLVHHIPLLVWPAILINYFLAMSNWFIPGAPYPFAWSAPWEHSMGAWIVLIPLGAAAGLGGGWFGIPYSRRLSLVTMGLGIVLLTAFGLAGLWAASETWAGVPV